MKNLTNALFSVVCQNNEKFEGRLTVNKSYNVYGVLGDSSGGNYRIIDDNGLGTYVSVDRFRDKSDEIVQESQTATVVENNSDNAEYYTYVRVVANPDDYEIVNEMMNQVFKGTIDRDGDLIVDFAGNNWDGVALTPDEREVITKQEYEHAVNHNGGFMYSGSDMNAEQWDKIKVKSEQIAEELDEFSAVDLFSSEERELLQKALMALRADRKIDLGEFVCQENYPEVSKTADEIIAISALEEKIMGF